MKCRQSGISRHTFMKHPKFHFSSTSSFSEKFGEEKEEIFDRILDMKPEDIQLECQKYGLPIAEMKIRNIQTIINYLNQQDRELQGIIKPEQPEQVKTPIFKKPEDDPFNLEKAKKNMAAQMSRLKKKRSAVINESEEVAAATPFLEQVQTPKNPFEGVEIVGPAGRKYEMKIFKRTQYDG